MKTIIFLIAGFVATDVAIAELPVLPWLSHRLASDQQRLQTLNAQLDEIPQPTYAGRVPRGFHSEYLTEPNQPASIKIDMYGPRTIDTLVMVPAVTTQVEDGRSPYGFPESYRIDGSLDGENWTNLVDGDGRGVGSAPVFHSIPAAKFRYLRITPTTHWMLADGLYVFALSEFMAFDGDLNHALFAKPEPVSSLDSAPRWGRSRLCDGVTSYGIPVDGRQPPEEFGFCSNPADSRDTEKWVQLDLGERKSIGEVRLIPAAPTNDLRDNFGFPIEFSVELCNDPDFPADQIVASRHAHRTMRDAGPVPISVRTRLWPNNLARFVRVRAQTLSGNFAQRYVHSDRSEGGGASEDVVRSPLAKFGFALAEVQVLEDSTTETNMALGCKVTSSDGENLIGVSGWSLPALVDGYACQGKLVNARAFLEQQGRREELTRDRDQLVDDVERERAVVQTRLATLIGFVVAVGLIAVLVSYLRQRGRLRDQIHQLRRQIARDLHDEVGSSLATIRIASELAADTVNGTEDAKTEFESIGEQAKAASTSMRDIVWLIDSDNGSSRQLLTHLKGLAKSMLSGHRLEVTEDEQWASRTIPIETRRNIVYAFKETLTNINKHAGAKHVQVHLEVKNRLFSFVVADDGVGMPQVEESPSAGTPVNAGETASNVAQPANGKWRNGHVNLRARATEGRGKCRIGPAELGGTQVSWSIRIT